MNFFLAAIQHWKTSTAGIAAALLVIANSYQAGMTWKQWALAAALAFFGIAAGDGKVVQAVARMILLALLLPLGARAQGTPAAPVDLTTLFAVGTDAVALHLGGQTVAAADAFGEFAITNKVTLRSDSILAPANGFQGYYGRAKYILPLDALFAKTNLPKKTFQAYIGGGGGIVRFVPATGPGKARPSFLAGGGLKYDPTASGKFTITLLDANYVNASGFGPSPHGFTLMVGIKLNLWTKPTNP